MGAGRRSAGAVRHLALLLIRDDTRNLGVHLLEAAIALGQAPLCKRSAHPSVGCQRARDPRRFCACRHARLLGWPGSPGTAALRAAADSAARRPGPRAEGSRSGGAPAGLANANPSAVMPSHGSWSHGSWAQVGKQQRMQIGPSTHTVGAQRRPVLSWGGLEGRWPLRKEGVSQSYGPKLACWAAC